MDEKCLGNSIKIRTNIKNESKFRYSAKSIYHKIVNIYGDVSVS